MNSKKLTLLFFLFSFLITGNELTAQVSMGGIPPSFGYKNISDDFMVVELPDIDYIKIASEDMEGKKNGLPYRYAVNREVDLNTENSGTWTDLKNGDRIWRLKIVSPGALAIGLYYRTFYLPAGTEFFLFNDEKTKIIGAYTSINNKDCGAFATELIKGEIIILEYYEPYDCRDKGVINISEISHAYRSVGFITDRDNKDFGDSDFCEININCPEGTNWQDEKRGVARVSVKMGINSYWCSGSLVNNVRQDFTQFFLTADHCGTSASVIDFSKWIFYFNYEASSCDDPANEPTHNSVSGCKKLANGGNSGVTGSDFLLLEILEDIPETYNVYFNGWNNSITASAEGVTIHHPEGDIQKISTYTKPVVSSNWNGSQYQSHWKVYWSATTSGHGVTEGGSSGSPLFNNNGEIVGSLTGGAAACETGGAGPGTGPNQPDYYGKFSYHWKSNGATPSERLRDWLDPDDTQVTSLKGINIYPTLDFNASKTTIKTGEVVSFTDISTGIPPDPNNKWSWEFEGGEPLNSIETNPKNVKYNIAGTFDVKLEIKLADTTLVKTKTDFIRVTDDVVVFPNPSRDFVYLDIMGNEVKEGDIFVFNVMGQQVKHFEIESGIEGVISLGNFVTMPSGVYFISIRTPAFTKNLKFTLNK